VGDAVLATLYAVVLAGGWAAGELLRPPPRRPWATVAALVVVGVPSLVQLTVAHGLLGDLQRVSGELGDGQVWRLVTSLVVQDGGWAGTLFNLAELAVVGAVAERVWGPARWCAIWLVAGIGAQFWGMLVQPVGGGNSVATFGLAASLAVRALRVGDRRARLCAAGCLAAGLVLLVGRDVHGGAVVLGAAVGLLLSSTRAGGTAAGPRLASARAPGSRP
jgi:membrane associated rhomboid family serine protease